MLLINRILILIISIESIIISSMIPLNITIPSTSNFFRTLEFPVNIQIPIIVFLTLIFSGDLLIKAFSIYIFIGLLILPVFNDGGSLGYILTPNFGYLLGTFPLIKIVDILNNKEELTFLEYLKYTIIAILVLHLTGILYTCFQLLLFNKTELILYNFGKFTLNKILYHILMIAFTFKILKISKKLKFLIK